MATKTHRVRKQRPRVLTREQARELFDRQSRKYLNLSREQFIRKWKAGKFNGESDSPNVIHLALLLPFAK
jgi:hypothetical protein